MTETTLNLGNIDLGSFGTKKGDKTVADIVDDGVAQRAKASASSAFKINPDQHAKNMSLSQQSGIPIDAVEADPGSVESDLKLKNIDFNTMSKRSPNTARFMTDFDNSTIAQDDIDVLQVIEGLIGSLGGGALDYAGGAFEGAGRTLEVAGRTMARGADAVLPDSFNDILYGDLGVAPSKFLRWEGGGLKSTAQIIKPNADDQNLATDIAAGVGQMAAQIASFIVSAPITTVSMFTTGVDQLGERQERTGSEGESLTSDLAMLTGGSVTMVTERLGIDKILERVPPAIKNDVIRNLVDIGIAGGIEAVQEVIEGVSHALIEKYTTNPDAEIFEGLDREALAAGGTGVIVRAVVNAVTRGRQRPNDNTDVEQNQIDKINKSATESKLRERSVEKFHQFVESSDGDNNTQIYIDREELIDYLNNQEGTDPVLELLTDLATESGTGAITVPVADFASRIAGTPHYDALRPYMTLSADTASPARKEKMQQDAEEYMNSLVEQAQENVSEYVEAQDIFNTVREQLIDSGAVSPANAAIMAQVVPAWATVYARDNNISVMEAYQRSGLIITGPQTGEAQRLQEMNDFILQQNPVDGTVFEASNDADAFAAAIEAAKAASPKGAAVFQYPTADYSDMQLYTGDDGKVGFAIKADGDLVSVFKHPESSVKGAMEKIVPLAVKLGANKLDAFEGFLTDSYAKLGFEETGRAPFDEDKAPEGWDFDTMGRPDVVFMELSEEAKQQRDQENEATEQTNQRRERVNGAVPTATGVLGQQNEQDQKPAREADGSLQGLPRIEGWDAKHSERIEDTARRYAESAGIDYRPPNRYAPVEPARAERIAAEYDNLVHDPQNPDVKASYDAMIAETIAQYQAAIDSGLQVEFINYEKDGDPYASSPRLAIKDIVENNHMWVFSTRDGFGSDVEFDPIDNPLLAETDFEISGQTALANDLFRVVHDYFGHAKEGVGFRAGGEENAWRAHSAMFSPLARKAMTTETRGQNSWVNFGPYAETNRTASGADTHYADQKVALLPDWVVNEGAGDDVQIFNQAGRGPRGDGGISTRLPTAKGSTENSLLKPLIVGLTAAKKDRASFEKNAEVISGYTNYRPAKSADNADKVVNRFITHVKNNLLWLHDQVPVDVRGRSHMWYTGARNITDRWVDRFGLPDTAIAGVIAALSPQKDWYMNVSLGERVLDTYVNRSDVVWGSEMDETAARIFSKPQYAPMMEAIKGKTLEQLSDPIEIAAWIRTYDETFNDRGHRITSPEGYFHEFATTNSGTKKKTGWGSLTEIAKAVAVIQDPSIENVNTQMGEMHKVRNFYNNIIAPDSDKGDVTIDTHAVAAGLLKPLSGKATEVTHNFGGVGIASSSKTGVSGTYGIYADAYRKAAKARGILPRQMQSITWEAVRGLFPATYKSQQKNVDIIEKLWADYRKGKASLETTWEKINEHTNGIENPTWYGSPGGVDESTPDSSYASELPGAGISGRSTGAAVSGGRSSTAEGSSGALNQNTDEKIRGFYDPENSMIRLTEAADLSTFLHEFAHFMYEMELKSGNSEKIQGAHKWFKRNSDAVVKEANSYLARDGEPLNQEPAFRESIHIFESVRDKFLDELPEDATFEDVMESIDDFSKEYRNFIKALERDDWLGFEYPAQAISAALSEDINDWDPSQGLKASIGRMVNAEIEGRRPFAQGEDPDFTVPPPPVITDTDLNNYLDNGTTGQQDKDQAIRRAIHEQFARGFEKYLMEGKAPSIEMRNIFATFARWMTQIYRSIKNALNINIDDEMRQVFDRLIATEEQIEAAKVRAQYKPMFTDAAMAGMTDDEFAEYQEKQNKVKDKETETLRDKLVREITRQTKSWWKIEKADIVDEEMNSLKTEPVYRAADTLRNSDLKLDHAVIKELYGAETTDKLGRKSTRIPSKLRGMTITGARGVNPDEAAAFFGFNSGDEMVNAIIESPTIKETADTNADAKMKERHGDILNDGTIEQLADEALQNETRGELLLSELRTLAKQNKTPTLDRATIKALAEENIGKLAYRSIHPGKYRKAEIRAAQEAAVALEKGDSQAAMHAKSRQVMNYYLGMAATEARNDTLKIVDNMARYNKKSVQQSIMKAEGGYWEQIVKVLERFEFRKSKSLKSVDQINEDINSWMKGKIEEEGDGLVLSAAVLNETYITHWKNVPFSDLKGIRDSVQNIEHVAKYADKISVMQEQLDFKKLVSDWTAHIKAQDERFPTKSSRSRLDDARKATTVETLRRWASQLSKMPFVASWLDGGERTGMSHQILNQRFTEALDAKLNLIDVSARPVFDAIMNRSHEDLKRHNRKIFIPEINDHLMGHQVLAVALNVGNAGNLRKLLLGEGWADPDVDADISRDNPKLQAVLAHMSKSDWKLVQTIWDQMETLYPQLAEVHRRTTGIAPPKVEATPFTVMVATETTENNSGEPLELSGGYYPVKYSRKRSHNAEKNAEKVDAETDSMFNNTASIQASVNAGATNERTGFYDAIHLSLDVVPDHFNEVIHFITHHDAVRQVNKLINNNDVADAITGSLGEAEFNQMKTWLNNIAKDGRQQPVKTFIDEAFQRLRFGTTLSIMGFKASTGIMQLFGIMSTMSELGLGPTLKGVYTTVGKSWYMNAVRRTLGSTQDMQTAWDFASERSKIMNHRVDTMDREIRNAMNRLTKPKLVSDTKLGSVLKVIDKAPYLSTIQEVSMKHIALIQTYMVDLPTWTAAYEKGMADWNDETRAVQFADLTVENTQGSGATKDMSTLLQNQNKVVSTMTMFMTFFSSLGALSRDLVKGARKGVYSPTNVAAKSMFLFTLPVFFEMLMRGELDEPEDEDERLSKLMTGIALYPLQSIPMVRDVASGLIGDFGYNPSPVFSMLEKGISGYKQISERSFTDEEYTKSAVKNAVKLTGSVLGVPGTSQAWATGEHMFDVIQEGEEATVREFIFGPDRN